MSNSILEKFCLWSEFFEWDIVICAIFLSIELLDGVTEKVWVTEQKLEFGRPREVLISIRLFLTNFWYMAGVVKYGSVNHISDNGF